MKTHHRALWSMLMTTLLLSTTACTGADDETTPASAAPVPLIGQAQGIDEVIAGWSAPRLALVTIASATINGEIAYSAGEVLVQQPLSSDGTFNLVLPSLPDDHWFLPMTPASASFEFVAYDDRNGNGKLDIDGADPDEPHELLLDADDLAGGFFYVEDADLMNRLLKSKVTVGWNYLIGRELTFSHDFDRDWVLEPIGS